MKKTVLLTIVMTAILALALTIGAFAADETTTVGAVEEAAKTGMGTKKKVLIGAGILNLKQAVSIVMGANIGTTVTAQIIRLMDIETSGGSILTFFKPNTLAPIALIIGIILVMFANYVSKKYTETGLW